MSRLPSGPGQERLCRCLDLEIHFGKGVVKAMSEDGVLGIFKGGFTASAVGISGALVFGYLGAIIFRPGMKE